MTAFNTKDLKSEINTIVSNEADKSTNGENTINKISFNMSSTSPSKHKSTDDDVKEPCTSSSQSDLVPRPHTLDDLVEKGKLVKDCNSETTFTYDELSEDDEFWIVDIPKTINPLHLKGQTLQLGNKSNFKIGQDKYITTNRESKSSLTCIFNVKKNESNTYKAVNIKPSGTVSVRRKLSGISRNKVPYEKSETVPFPKNIKLRHPFFGVQFVD